MIEVHRAVLDAARRGERAVLVTVVAATGSCPQGAGSKMLVRPDGSLVGTIGGGAWEHRVTELALQALAEGTPKLVRFSLTRDLAMCCGGTMEAFIEPVPQS